MATKLEPRAHDLTVYLQQESVDLRSLLKRTSEHIALIGQRLILIRARLKQGKEFYVWCEQELGISRGTAENFMNASVLLEKFPRLGNHNLEVIYMLAAPSMPEEIVQGVENGSIQPDVKAIKGLKREYNEEPEDGNGSNGRAQRRLSSHQVFERLVDLVENSELYVLNASEELVDQASDAMEKVLDTIHDGKIFKRNRRKKILEGLLVLNTALSIALGED